MARSAKTVSEKPRSNIDKIYVVNGRTIDFENLELTKTTRNIRLTLMEVKLLRYLIENAEKPFRAKRFSKKSGICTKTPTRARSIILSSACAAIWKTSRTIRKILQTVRGVGYKFV
jgi:DNA-binding response OmpR family regulator